MNKLVTISVLVLFLLIVNSSCRDEANPSETGAYYNSSPRADLIQVTAPVFGEVWKPGTANLIKWKVSANIKLIDLQLFKKNKFRFTIASRVQNDGSFEWVVPNNITRSVHYRIKLVNSSRTDDFNFSDTFYILGD